ncbi:MAG TPA: hypothetical protein VGS17_04315 [Candidatus Limnocylindria bacterium]|nr:hypothetical protein [Candidatus Limnocylindria bacterium]
MPFNVADRALARELVRELREFARLVGRISGDRSAPPHPEVKAMLASFRQINRRLEAGKGPGVVTLRQKVRIGQEFQKIGSALRARPKR